VRVSFFRSRAASFTFRESSTMSQGEAAGVMFEAPRR